MVLQNSFIHTEEVKSHKKLYFEQTIRLEQAGIGESMWVNCNSFRILTVDLDLANKDNCGIQQV